MGRHRFFEDRDWSCGLEPVAKIRVIYGDTDQMRVVYHGNYLRYMERARVEFMRQHGVVYAQLESEGIGLPVVDLALSYRVPARYDDEITVFVGLSRVSWARVHFVYRLALLGDDSQATDLLYAETRHGVIDMEHGSATRLTEEVYERLRKIYESRRQDQG